MTRPKSYANSLSESNGISSGSLAAEYTSAGASAPLTTGEMREDAIGLVSS